MIIIGKCDKGRRPTVKEKKLLKANGYNPNEWLSLEDYTSRKQMDTAHGCYVLEFVKKPKVRSKSKGRKDILGNKARKYLNPFTNSFLKHKRKERTRLILLVDGTAETIFATQQIAT